VRNPHAAPFQNRHVGFIHPHRVRRNRGRSNPQIVSVLVGVVCRLANSSSFSFLVSERWITSGARYLLASARAAFSVVGIGVQRVRRHAR